jgi:outer membrane protein assembly factor BamD
MPKIFLLLLLLLSACAQDTNFETLGPGEIYDIAYKKLMDKDYSEASDTFAEVERNHPYSKWAGPSMVMTAYANYQGGQYLDTISYADAFLDSHPGSPLVPYVLYLKAMSYYMQIPNVERDQSDSLKSMQVMQELLKRFPDTEYAKDVETKIEIAKNYLAGQEMEIGRKYLLHHDFIGAINRFQNVVKNFDTTAQTPEALYRLVETNLILGLPSEAKIYAKVLNLNYPKSDWNKKTLKILQ